MTIDQSYLISPKITYYLLPLFFPIFLLYILLKKKKQHGSRSTPPPPPSPPALPLIGHLHLMGPVVQKSFHGLAGRYGPLLQLRLGSSCCILVSNCVFAKEVLKTQELNFVSRPGFGSSDFYKYKDSGFFLAPYGAYWKFMKKLIVTRLLSKSQLDQLIHTRENEIEKLLRSLIEVSEKGECCNLSSKLVGLMNNVICAMSMSTRCSGDEDEAKKMKDLLDEMVYLGGKLSFGEVFGAWIGRLDLFGYGERLVQVLDKFDLMMDEIIEKKEEKMGGGDEGRKKSTGSDLLDILLECSKDSDAEYKLTKDKIKGFFLDVFTAGTDTAAGAMQWTITELINHPAVFKKLREEIESVIGSTRRVKESDLPRLPYLQAVTQESLRLHPPVFTTPRECKEDCIVNGFKIKAKARVLINLYSIMRDPNHWIQPDKFIPERFIVDPSTSKDSCKIDSINNELQMIKASQGLEYLPFGSGRRSCPGYSLALLETQTVVGSLVQCFDWKVKDGDKIDTREGSDGMASKMLSPIECYPILRFNPFVN